MVESFATPEQFQSRYPVSEADKNRLEGLLGDASGIIRHEIPPTRLTDDSDMLASTVCAMVQRALAASSLVGDGVGGVSQTAQTAGSFTQSWTFTNPSGDLYITKAEKRRLSTSFGQTGFHIDMAGGA